MFADLVVELMRGRAGLPVSEERVWRPSEGVTLADVIRKVAQVEEFADPPTPEMWYRFSGISYLCPREEIIAGLLSVKRTWTVTADEAMTYSLGAGWHFVMQNEFLGPAKALYGIWDCWNCHTKVGSTKNPALRPDSCPNSACKVPGKDGFEPGKQFMYEEMYLRSDEYRLHGHPDGIVEYGGRKRLLELKTIGLDGFKHRVDMAPDPNHVVQANLYMWKSGLREAVILYYGKGAYGMRGLREYEIDYDEGLVRSTLSTISTIRVGLRTGKLTPRLLACSSKSSDRAKECPMCKECFRLQDRVEKAA